MQKMFNCTSLEIIFLVISHLYPLVSSIIGLNYYFQEEIDQFFIITLHSNYKILYVGIPQGSVWVLHYF